ncbi:hypothetical protein IK110_03760 [Candidatus Saccharibacteria bacterium]|nr:hypothetical protein [Candidatus Saccharibacteria bacterium]
MSKGTLKALLIWAGIVAIIMAIVNYLAIPAWNIHSSGIWWFWFAALWLFALGLSLIYFFDYDFGDNEMEPISLIVTWIATGVFTVIFIICGIASSAMCNAHKLHDIAKVTVKDVDINDESSDFKDVAVIANQENIPLVDLDTAITLGDKKIASLPHASWYDVDDEYNLIKYQDEYYRLSTIDYAGGYFKWNKAQYDGVPGYVLVPVTPENGIVTQEAILVTLEQPIIYTPGAYFSKDLSRHLRNQYPNYIFDRSFMEIDEEGTPYWVTGVFTPTAGLFGGKVVNSFILTNAQTGASEEYSIENAPEWIDHIYSLGYLMDMAYWHYAYGNGYWNDTFGQANVLRTSYCYRDTNRSDNEGAEKFANFYGYSSIIDKDGQVCFYTGLTAANKAESNLGWLVVDTSTGKMTQYNLVGAEEHSAQLAVEQLVQEKGYQATFPLPVNIAGEPSYLMCLKGKAGLVQSYAICNMNNYSIAVEAETLPKAINKYQAKLTGTEMPEGTTDMVDVAPVGDVQTGSGKITEVYTAELNGTTQFYYVIDGELYRSSITIDERQVLYKAGTTISFEYYVSDNIRVITKIT